MRKIILSLMAIMVLSSMLGGQNLVLPDMLKGDMVLQQQTKAKIWGKAEPGSIVEVIPGWNLKTYSAKASVDSLWEIGVDTPKAGYDAYSMTIRSGAEQLIVNDILIGEVWICGGQSNMEMPLKGMSNCYVEGAAHDILMSGTHKGLRYMTVTKHKEKASRPGLLPEGKWYPSGPASAADFSAVGYHFGATLSEALGIPVGLINCSWSGSFLEDWVDSSFLAKHPDQKIFGAEFSKAYTQLYYGMLEPVSKYTIRGMIWYQGESNVGSPDYDVRLAEAVKLWSGKFQLNEFPFFIVELAPFEYSNGFEGHCAYFRELQFAASKTIPSSGLVSTNDLAYPYETAMIHPANKKPVGQRLAMLAMSKTYGYGNPCEGPCFKEMSLEDGKAVLSFNNAPNGFMQTGEVIGFEIAGEDRIFHPAKARFTVRFPQRPRPGEVRKPGEMSLRYGISLESPEVANPVAVRYCFKDFQIGNVHNTEGFPLVPFRTDNWPVQ
jgi:sialate O-acetylesterase